MTSEDREDLTEIRDALEEKPDEIGLEALRVAVSRIAQYLLAVPGPSATEEALRIRLADALQRALTFEKECEEARRRASLAEAEVERLRGELGAQAEECERLRSEVELLAKIAKDRRDRAETAEHELQACKEAHAAEFVRKTSVSCG